MPARSSSAWGRSCWLPTAGLDEFALQQHVELQQLLVTELLAAAELEVLLQQLATLGRIPAQRLQQLIALLQQITAP
jgi:hypothetical protein